MPILTVSQLIPVLQTAIGPMLLISGVGLFVLTMTNRLGRAIDRARLLSSEIDAVDEATKKVIQGELRILWKRAQLIRAAITLVSTSALLAALLIITLFFTALWGLETSLLISGLFIACMVCLSASLVIFIHDINQSLAALKLELKIDGK